jgi:hypothetical protein
MFPEGIHFVPIFCFFYVFVDIAVVIHLIPSQPVFALSPYCCMLSGEATNTNFIVFGLTRSMLLDYNMLLV